MCIRDSNTGATMLESAKILKSLGANRVFCVASFAIFTSGFEAFNQAHDMGIIERVFATNLTYCPPVVQNSPWFYPVSYTHLDVYKRQVVQFNARFNFLRRGE